MAFQRIRIKNTNVAGKVPGADKLDTAELCVNLKDEKLFSKNADGDVFELGGGSASVPGGDTPPGSGNSIGDLFFDTVNEILLYWDGTQWLPVTGDGYVKLDDNGTRQSIVGGGGIDLLGSMLVEKQLLVGTDNFSVRNGITCDGDVLLNTHNYGLKLFGGNNFDTSTPTVIRRDADGETIIKETGGWGTKVFFSATEDYIILGNNNPNGSANPNASSTAHVHAWGGFNSEFGTSAAQLGNVAPMNDWSCYPARA